MSSSIKMVIFDVDGVVVDSFELTVSAINRTLRQFGGNLIGNDFFHNNHFGSMRDFMLSRGLNGGVEWEEVERFLEGELDHPERCFEMPGARNALTYVKNSGCPIYLISACNGTLTERKINHHHGLIEFVDGIHGGENKEEIVRFLCRRHSFPIRDIAFVSDMGRDFTSGFTTSLKIGVISPFSNEKELDELADVTLPNMSAVADFLCGALS